MKDTPISAKRCAIAFLSDQTHYICLVGDKTGEKKSINLNLMEEPEPHLQAECHRNLKEANLS